MGVSIHYHAKMTGEMIFNCLVKSICLLLRNMKIEKIVKQRTLKSISGRVQILPVTYGRKAATKGAVSLILNKVLKLKNIDDFGATSTK